MTIIALLAEEVLYHDVSDFVCIGVYMERGIPIALVLGAATAAVPGATAVPACDVAFRPSSCRSREVCAGTFAVNTPTDTAPPRRLARLSTPPLPVCAAPFTTKVDDAASKRAFTPCPRIRSSLSSSSVHEHGSALAHKVPSPSSASTVGKTSGQKQAAVSKMPPENASSISISSFACAMPISFSRKIELSPSASRTPGLFPDNISSSVVDV